MPQIVILKSYDPSPDYMPDTRPSIHKRVPEYALGAGRFGRTYCQLTLHYINDTKASAL